MWEEGDSYDNENTVQFLFQDLTANIKSLLGIQLQHN